MLTSIAFHDEHKTPCRPIISLFLLSAMLIVPATASAALKIDGKLDEADWAQARVFRDFVVIDPLTFDSPRVPTEARLLSIPEGLAVAFICEQPPEETRTRTITQLDAQQFYSDSVSLMIDFDGTSKIAYEFSVSLAGSYRDGTITGEISFNYDWDGLWERAVSEEADKWTVEMLLPWSIAAMREADGETRTVGVSFQRKLYSRNETFAFPTATLSGARFISDFAKVEIPNHTAQEFDVWPYVTVLSDLVKESTKGKAGLDFYWKPSSRFQVVATVNPDFGQVESDDLVIDFSATEVTFSDKRPFFTENQGIFNLKNIPRNDIFYTRRIGGPSDDGGHPSNIDAAVKIIGSASSLDYGIFAAKEDGDAGRSFYAGRLVFPADNWTLGAITTYVERPFKDRTALVNVVDFDMRLGKTVHWLGKLISSDIDSTADDSLGYGTYTILTYEPSEQVNYKVTASYYSDEMDINDMGYVYRNGVREVYIVGNWIQTGFPEKSRSASVSWSLGSVIGQNTDGDTFPIIISANRRDKLRSGSEMAFNAEYKTDGYDDTISRGYGLVRLNKRLNITTSYTTQRRGQWRKSLGVDLIQEGYKGWGVGINTSISWYPNEKLNLDFSLKPRWSSDWLIWMHHDLLASFSKRQVTGQIGAAWFPAEGHEVRLKTQWYVINADAAQGYRIGSGGWLVASNDPIKNFAMINFGLQLRYRYEIAPLSDFYLVYSRGGIDRIDDPDQSTWGLLGESTSIRKADQILAKLRYRF